MPSASQTSGSQPDSCHGAHRKEAPGINRRTGPALPASPKAAGTSIQHTVTHSSLVLMPPAGTLLWTASCLILYTTPNSVGITRIVTPILQIRKWRLKMM